MYNRFDVLAPVHKGIRYALSGLCFQAGSMSIHDEEGIQSFVNEFKRVVTILDSHAHDEDAHVQHLYERFAPNTAAKLEEEHTVMDAVIHELQEMLETIRHPHSIEERSKIWYEINRKLTRFTADYFQHLQREEGEAAEALWANLDDDQLMDLSVKIRSSIPPSTMMIFLYYMLPALDFNERFGILNGMKQFAPPEAYEAVRGLAETRLSPQDWNDLKGKLNAA